MLSIVNVRTASVIYERNVMQQWWNDNDRVKVNVKLLLYRPGVAQRVGRGIALLFHDRGTRRG